MQRETCREDAHAERIRTVDMLKKDGWQLAAEDEENSYLCRRKSAPYGPLAFALGLTAGVCISAPGPRSMRSACFAASLAGVGLAGFLISRLDESIRVHISQDGGVRVFDPA